jgi:predicted ATP-dependent endonuclease of OLD family
MDDVTSFVGPNGTGKSTVLRALDWFFNDDKGVIDEGDIYSGVDVEDPLVSVEVTFDSLTPRDRKVLGDTYAPEGTQTFTVWRTWQSGSTKTTGRGRAYPPFEKVRAIGAAAARRTEYSAILAAQPELGLAKWTNVAAADDTMRQWERENPNHLEDADITAATHFFGFNGHNVLSGLFDYVLVTADLRAGEESTERKTTIIGRILERAIDRAGAQDQFDALAEEVSKRQAEINETFISGQLTDLGKALTEEVTAFTAGREVHLNATTPELKPAAPAISVSICDALTETSVDRQGHGFQRALLISSLKLLAQRNAQNIEGSVICLAIEEPELFQHPGRARVFARVLRDLAQDEGRGIQVAYATHSPHFVDPRYFDQVRRVTRRAVNDDSHPTVSVQQAAMDDVVTSLDGFVKPEAIRSRWEQVCMKDLAEAFFADAVILVEGEDDKGVMDGIAARTGMFEADGITVATAAGKGHMFTAHSILKNMGIPTLVVFDNDSGCRKRTLAKPGKGSGGIDREQQADQADKDARTLNRKLLKYFGMPEVDWPVGLVDTVDSTGVFAWDDRIEETLDRDWSQWESTRQDLIASGRGVNGKNAATYALAASKCPIGPSGALVDAVVAARRLVTS